nr:hypothetical protein [Tanacetum cinerariifolium]
MSFSPSPTPCGGSGLLLGEIDTLLSHSDDSLPDYETFCFDTEEKSRGSTTSHFDHSLSDYKSICFDVDHIEEKSSGSTPSKSDHSLPDYEAFCFDHIEEKSSSKYDHFYFDLEDDPGELTRLLKKDISETLTKDLTINKLNDFHLLIFDCDSTSKGFSEIDLLVSFTSGHKDKIFDPGIVIIKGVQSQRFHILLLDDFSTISFVSDSLFLTDPSEI